MSDSETVISVQEVAKEYRLGRTVVHALRGVSLNISAGEFLALSGPSGSGKTTLLNMIGCIERPSRGRVVVDGNPVHEMDDRSLSILRREKIGFIFQTFNLLPVLTALENVEYPLILRRVPVAERRERARRALADVGLGDHERHKPMELSGGQRQRVAIARAIVGAPAVILADEPTANLDHATGEQILDLMKDLNDRRGTTFVFSTHDSKVTERASRIVPLWDGLLRDAGSS